MTSKTHSNPRDFRLNMNYTNKGKIVKDANGVLPVSRCSSNARDIPYGTYVLQHDSIA